MKFLKKAIVIIMLIIMILGQLPISSLAKFIIDIDDDAKFGVISDSLKDFGHEMHYALYDSTKYLVFCTQYGKNSPSGNTYKYNDDFLVEYKEERKSYKEIAEYIYFGYTMQYGTGLPSTKAEKKAAAATQQFVWEYIYKNINDEYGYPKRDSWNSKYMSSDIYKEWLKETEEYYNNYHGKGVSFDGKTKKVAIGESQIFEDKNKALKDYASFSKVIDGVKFEHEKGSNNLKVTVTEKANSNKVKFKSNSDGIYRLMPNGEKFDKSKMSNYMYIKFKKGAIQNLMFSNYVDPDYFTITIGVESGDLELLKTDNNDIPLQGCTFKIYEDEACTDRVATATTDVNGKILFDSLSPGDYFVKETKVPSRISN